MNTKVQSCWRCDFASGYRGMDRCHVCDGTGSVFRTNDEYFPNTESGYKMATRNLVPLTPADRLRAAMKTLRWSNCDLAAEVRRDEKQVRRWLAGTHQPSAAILDWLEALAEHYRANPAP